MNQPAPPDGVVEYGRIIGVFGVRGEVRLFLHHRESTWLHRHRTVLLVLGDQRLQVGIRARRGTADRVIGRIDGVDSREAAQAWVGATLWVERQALPKLQRGEFYIQDVVGAQVFEGDEPAGTVRAVHHAGPVDILEIAVAGEVAFVPCLRERIVAMEAGRVVIAPGALVRDEAP